jgi:hypothetical protein
LEFLEARLPLGDAFLGTLLGSWLIAPRLLPDSGVLNNSADQFHEKEPIAPLVAEPESQDLSVIQFSFPDDSLGTTRREATMIEAGRNTAGEVTGLASPDWTMLASMASSSARLTQAEAFSGMPHSDLSLAVTLGPLTQRRSPEMIPAVTHSSSGSATSAVNRRAVHSSSPNPSMIRQNYGQLPLSFEANVGQADSSVQYLAHGSGYGLYLTGTEAVMVVSQPAADSVGRVSNPSGADGTAWKPVFPTEGTTPSTVVRMQVLGGNPAPAVVGLDPLPDQVNYFLGNDPAKWHTHISTFAKVEYQNVYPGINLDYYGRQGQLEYDFVVAPGADPRVIHVGFTGADQLSLNAQGDLVLHAGEQDIVQHKPVVYQEVNGSRLEIASAFVVSGDQSLLTKLPLTTHEVSFALGAYDASRPLVIDPVLSYSTYLGGSGQDIGFGIAVDPNTGDALVTGITYSADFPTANPLQPNNGGVNAFVARLSADGSALVYSTYLGGSGGEYYSTIAVDPNTGDALITGSTQSTDFPTVNPLQPNNGGGTDAFVARLSADGSALVYSTYLGGSGYDQGYGIAVDPNTGDALITGSTQSADFPTVNPLQPNNGGGTDAFVARLSADGSTLVYSTYLGGSDNDYGSGIAVDPNTGDALVTGVTQSTNFPTANALQPNWHGGTDAFVARLSADGSTLVYSTYLGGSDNDSGSGIAVDPNTGDAFVTGETSSTNFPTTNAWQPSYGGGEGDVFVARIKADGSALVYSTYLGGSDTDVGSGIAVDPNTGDALVTGLTTSTNFPTVNPLQPNYGGGGGDAFVARLSANGTALVFSTYLGGNGVDHGHGIGVDANTGDALVTGLTTSTNFPTVNPLQPTYGGGSGDAFVARIVW